MHLRLTLLGSFQAWIGEEAIPISRAQKIEALLAYLVLESDHPHSRDFLDGLLFPEMLETAARNNLRQTLMRLRRLLLDDQAETPLLLLDSDRVQFNPVGDWELDIDTFQQKLKGCPRHQGKRSEQCPECMELLAAGLDLYQGPFLEGFALRDSELFESWMCTWRERLQLEAIEGYRTLIKYYELCGDYPATLKYARRWLDLDSYSEEAHRQIMHLLAWQGQRTQALAQYKRCQQLLENELNMVPEPETEALANRIRTMSTRRPHNLPPIEGILFVGRRQELEKIRQMLTKPDHRLMTLVGPGGIGKTRLALQIGWMVTNNHIGPFIEGIYFVPLIESAGENSLLSGISLTMAIIQALKIKLTGTAAPEAQLLDYLKRKELLLIIDNCEILDSKARSVIATLLQKTQGIKILTTSRQRLNLIQEWVLEIEGLPYPQGSDSPAPAELENYESIQLFAQRARQIDAEFSLESCPPQDQLALKQIGYQTQGMPLALELAAVWVRRLTCSQIVAEIQKNLDLLAWDTPEIPERHRCIRAVFESSWQLLTAEEQTILAGLSVFSGSFNADAAGQIVNATLLTLASLQDKSLIQKERQENSRYTLHPLLHQFLAEKLSLEETRRYKTAHAGYFAQFLAQRREAIDNVLVQETLNEIELDLENVREGWRWSVTHQKLELLGEYMHPLYGFYVLRTWWVEGQELFTQAAALVPENLKYEDVHGTRYPLIYAGLLLRLAEFNYNLSMLEQAEALLRRSQAIQNWSEDPEELALIYEKMGLLAYRRGDYPRAVQMLQFSYQIAHDADLKNLSAHILMSLGALARDQEDYPQARKCLQESLTIYRALEYPWGIANALRLLGYVTCQSGDKITAQICYEESIRLCQEIKNPIMEALVWNNLGQMAHVEKNYGLARELYERGIRLLQEQSDDKSQALLFESLGNLELDMEQLPEAHLHLEKSLEAATKAQDTGASLRILIAMARLAVKKRGSLLPEQIQITEFVKGIVDHPACPAPVKKEALSYWPELAAAPLEEPAKEVTLNLSELKMLGQSILF